MRVDNSWERKARRGTQKALQIWGFENFKGFTFFCTCNQSKKVSKKNALVDWMPLKKMHIVCCAKLGGICTSPQSNHLSISKIWYTRPWDRLFLKLSCPQKLLYNSRLEFYREFKNIIHRFIHGEAGNHNQTLLFLLKWLKNFFVNIPSWRDNRVTRVDRKC